MSFDNRLIEARCIGGAWSLGEAHSQNVGFGMSAVEGKADLPRKSANIGF